jgi:hypothetical protein
VGRGAGARADEAGDVILLPRAVRVYFRSRRGRSARDRPVRDPT